MPTSGVRGMPTSYHCVHEPQELNSCNGGIPDFPEAEETKEAVRKALAAVAEGLSDLRHAPFARRCVGFRRSSLAKRAMPREFDVIPRATRTSF
jgi:hypothetical protein